MKKIDWQRMFLTIVILGSAMAAAIRVSPLFLTL